MTGLSFDAVRDEIATSPAFEGACKRYRRGGGPPEAIAMAVLVSIDYADLYLDALRYRYLRTRTADTINAGDLAAGIPSENLVLVGNDLDAHVDACLTVEI